MPRASSEQMRSYFGFLVGNYAGSVDLFGVNRSVDVKPDYNLSSSRFSRCNYTLFFLMINLIFCVVLNVQYFSKIIVIVFNRTWEFSKQNKSFNKVTRCCPQVNQCNLFSFPTVIPLSAFLVTEYTKDPYIHTPKLSRL